jgi:hypothetical protein
MKTSIFSKHSPTGSSAFTAYKKEEAACMTDGLFLLSISR